MFNTGSIPQIELITSQDPFMETFKINQEKSKDSITLNQFLSRIITAFQAIASRQKSNFVNDVPPNVSVQTDANILSEVLSELFTAILRRCEDCNIRLTSKSFHNVILIHITILSGFQGIHEVENMNEINHLAERLGGCILYNNQHLNESTFTLSLFNFLQLAA